MNIYRVYLCFPFTQKFGSSKFIYIRDPNIDKSNLLDTVDNSDDSTLNLYGLNVTWKSLGNSNLLMLLEFLIYFLAYILNLSVEEISEWAEHAQRLPSNFLSNFLRHRISGIDFPSLIENNGQKLIQLGLTPHELKPKVLNNIKKLLTERVKKPNTPKNISIFAVSCSLIRIQWETVDDDNPTSSVHKYVVQRSSRKLFPFLHMTDASRKAAESWQTVCEGLDTTCDDWIPAGFTSSTKPVVAYRITAWNTLRRSDRVYLDISHLRTPRDRECPIVDQALSPLMKVYLKKEVISSLFTDPVICLAVFVIGLSMLLLMRRQTSAQGERLIQISI